MNPRQRVIAFGQSLCVTAGAGAGKTTCLVDAYLGLLAGPDGGDGLDPRAILAITFTDKAAAEMRSRIVQAVQKRLSAGERPERWAAALPRLEWAPISTIHAFCADLLREHGHLLGLDPDFGILDQDEYDQLREEAVGDLLKAKLEARDPGLAAALVHYRLQGQGQLDQALLAMTKAMSTSGLAWPEARARTAEAHREALVAKAEIVAEMDQAVQRLAGNIAAGLYPKNNKYFAKINKLVEIWPQISERIIDKPEMTAEDLAVLAGLVKGGWGKAKPERDVIAPAVNQLAGLGAVNEAAELAEDLLGLAEELATALDVELARRAALSFDHLLLLAVRLLEEHGPVREQLRERFGAVMVDEYQDINPVQGRLIELLAGQGDEQGGPRLLLVGDRKQSIYAFRGAEVSLYNQTMVDFAQKGGLVALAENFRSSHELVNFFNRLFEGVFIGTPSDEPAPAFGVAFSPDDCQTPAAPYPGSLAKPVMVLDNRHLADEDALAAQWREVEAESLAAYITGLLQGGVNPGDIVLLFRRLTQVTPYEEALRRAGSDYFTVRGAGLYDRQEIADISLALRALLDPGDSVALAGLLRSPMVGLSDEALLALTRPEAGAFVSVSEALQNRSSLPDWLGEQQQERWSRAIDLLARLSPMARRMSPADLIQELIESTDLDAVHMATEDGRQRAANLRKLIETARGPRAGLGRGVDNFAHGLARLVADPPQDAQAPLVGEEAQAVRLMTVHQAKGLEFNTVILPDLIWNTSRSPAGPQMDARGVLACQPFDPNSGERRSTPIVQQLREEAAERDLAEAARLFYVAVTRARQRLVFCLSGSKRAGIWHQWLQELVVGDPGVEMVRGELAQGGAAELTAPAGQWPGWSPAEPGPESAAGQEIVQRIATRTPAAQARFLESVTGLGNWLKCPRQYILVRRMGLDTANLTKTSTNGDKASGGGAVLGSLVHRALELADFSQGSPGTAAALELAAREHPVDAQTRQMAQERVADWWRIGLDELVASGHGPRLMREQDFRLHLPENGQGPAIQLIGSIDLLLEWADGQRYIIDYKVTDKIDSSPYVYQLALYCLAMRRTDRPIPHTALAFLSGDKSVLQAHDFSDSDLVEWEQTVRRAAEDIVSLPPEVLPSQLERPQTCDPAACPLAGLCLDGGAPA